MPDLRIRPILPQDNPRIATIIRTVLAEFGAARPGFAWQDPELDELSQAYGQPGYGYFVAEDHTGALLGGAGIGPFPCERPDCCELQKMYLIPAVRRLGIGQQLMQQCLVYAAGQGYRHCYLETLDNMAAAARLYRSNGFMRLAAPLGNSGHGGCNAWYLKRL